MWDNEARDPVSAPSAGSLLAELERDIALEDKAGFGPPPRGEAAGLVEQAMRPTSLDTAAEAERTRRLVDRLSGNAADGGYGHHIFPLRYDELLVEVYGL